MTLPSDFFLDKDLDLMRNQLERYLRILKEEVEGYTEDFTGKIYGSSTAGTGTYSVNDCFYLRRGWMVDVFVSLTWSGHSGSGDLRIALPFYVKPRASSQQIGSVMLENLALPTSTLWCVSKGIAGENYAIVEGLRSSGSKQTVQIASSGSINFQLSYIGQVKK